jgi:hypothetical protein
MCIKTYIQEIKLKAVLIVSEPSWWNAKGYYENRKARYTALTEFIKTPYAYLKYGIVEKLGLLEKLEDLEEKLKLKELFYSFTMVPTQKGEVQ